MMQDVQQILITQQQLHQRVQQLAQEIARDYADKDPVFIGVLKGVVVFYADMIRAFPGQCQLDFMWISSYAGTESTGKLQVRQDVSADLRGRHVIILEDIFDTGSSLQFVYEHLAKMQPASLKVCTLLDKPERRRPDVTLRADYTGFVIPNAFVVGYGLDYNEHYRNLPYIGVLKPEVYQN